MSKVVQVIRRFQVLNCCRDCGKQLNESIIFENRKALEDAWMSLVLSGPLTAGKCPDGCRSTFSDCNINTRMRVIDADTKEEFDLRNQRLENLPTTREEVV